MFAVRFCSRLKKYVSIERIIDCELLYIGVKEISVFYLPAFDITMTDCQSVAKIPISLTLCPATRVECRVLLRKVFGNLACGEMKAGAPELCFALWTLLNFLSDEAGGTHVYH